MPAIQLVNYLLSPLLSFSERLADASPFPVTPESARTSFARTVIHAVQVLATAIAHATGLNRGLEPVFRHLQSAR
jgi:hypothetical protein